MRIERQIIVRAKQKILIAASWYPQAELARLTSISSSDLEADLLRWKDENMIFSVSQLFPAYVFSDDMLKPLTGLQAILMLFAGKKNNWGATIG